MSINFAKKMNVMSNDIYISNNPLAVLKPEKEPRRYTLAEFLHREERSQELHEYYDGIITKLPMAMSSHNIIDVNMIFALKTSTWVVRQGVVSTDSTLSGYW